MALSEPCPGAPTFGLRVLVCAPFGRDAESVAALLVSEGYQAETISTLSEVAGCLDETLGALLVTEEALMPEASTFNGALAAQEAWSDIPIVFLAAPRSAAASWPKESIRLALPDAATNVVVLERPIGVVSLVSAINSAMKARQKQFEIRDRIEEQRLAAETLDLQVKERTAELEAALARLHGEIADRERAEEQLRQSQKMEVVGQLTGGIAHDFNNMLTGVIGSLDIVRRRLQSGRTEDLDRFMDAASTSAQRATNLTHRLLAFSRRQTLDSKPLDTNALVLSLEELLQRTIGERIQLEFALGDDLPYCEADTNQLESAIINLAVNARDAMPDGGTLGIETSLLDVSAACAAGGDLAAGTYVCIAVSDTGVGMSHETVAKVFEPFFTTKPIGEGTGLGLSMVYGFAKQSGGKVQIDSRLHEGTRVVLSLPVATGPMQEISPVDCAATAQPGFGEHVLIIEDEPAVRQLLRDALQELGYNALEASDGHAALAILTSGKKLDLVISDVGLPGINGRQLAEEARRHRPNLPILFVTGYVENAATRASFLGTNMAMITKPFTLELVAMKIRGMLRKPAANDA